MPCDLQTGAVRTCSLKRMLRGLELISPSCIFPTVWAWSNRKKGNLVFVGEAGKGKGTLRTVKWQKDNMETEDINGGNTQILK